MSPFPLPNLLASFSELFLICKFLGINPQELRAFHREKLFKKSNLGSIFVIITMSLIVSCNVFMIHVVNRFEEGLEKQQSTLTSLVTLFILYIHLANVIIDQISAIRHQRELGEIFERIRVVDEGLYKEEISSISNNSISRFIRIMLATVLMSHLINSLIIYVQMSHCTKLSSMLWMISIPDTYRFLDKIWFAGIFMALKQRFFVINQALEDLTKSHEKFKAITATKTNSPIDGSIDFTQFLSQRINTITRVSKGQRIGAWNKVSPTVISGDFKLGKNRDSLSKITIDSELNNISNIYVKLCNFCQIHNELCEIAKRLTELWNYQILICSAHAFLTFTTHLYFIYCEIQGQSVSAIFRMVKNYWVAIVYLSYVAGRITIIFFISWATSLEAKRTGVCLHKCGIIADNNNLYEIINHLSLKLLNHSVDFSENGILILNMRTMYGMSGGIVTYLIILIQFNLATYQMQEVASNISYANVTMTPV